MGSFKIISEKMLTPAPIFDILARLGYSSGGISLRAQPRMTGSGGEVAERLNALVLKTSIGL